MTKDADLKERSTVSYGMSRKNKNGTLLRLGDIEDFLSPTKLVNKFGFDLLYKPSL